jgi:hypothetical protein
MIINLHRMNTNNIGDLLSAPSLYFSLGDRMEIMGWKPTENPDRESRIAWKEKFLSATSIVIGGGGLLCSEFFEPAIRYILDNKNPDTNVVVWGAGHNEWKISDWRKMKCQLDLDKNFDLVGVRDYGHKYNWVPCPSCMNPAFDTISPPKQEVVVYAHEGTLRNPKLSAFLPKEFPTLSNSSDFKSAIEFISSGDLVLTDSYHGLYWATLLGRRVVAFPTSSKFYDVKHAVPLCDPRDWRRFADLATRYPFALQECREANLKFQEMVLNL